MFKNLDKTYVIAEIGINHNGSIDTVVAMIKAAKDAGADCVKFQKRDIDLVYTIEELVSPRKSEWGTTFRDQKEGLELDHSDYSLVHEVCGSERIDWSASPWDLNSIKFLVDLNVPFIKIPSALATDKKYLKACAETKMPLILSTGMCDENMINKIVWYLEDCKANLEVIMACTSTYPTSLSEINLNSLNFLKRNYIRTEYVFGYSGHDELTITGPLAVACGAKVIERHLTLDKTMEGSDQKCSLEPNEFAQMIRQIRLAETILGDGVVKIYESEIPIIKKLRKVDDFSVGNGN